MKKILCLVLALCSLGLCSCGLFTSSFIPDELIPDGFIPEKKYVDAEFIISLYARSGEDVSFVQGETATSQQEIICESKGVTLNAISLRTLAENEIVSLSTELEATSSEERKEKIRTIIANLTVFTSVE